MTGSGIVRCIFAAAFIVAVPDVHAQFHDNGFTQTPIVRTEYTNSQTGTASIPLTLGPCLFGSCIAERTVYPQANYWRQNWPCNADSCANVNRPYDAFWSLILNNEPRNDPRNSGPPDASLPRSLPGQGLFGFATLFGNANFAGDNKWRAHLVTNFINFRNPIPDGTPFEGFGEFSARGNGARALAYLRPSPATRASVLTWGERLWGPPNFPTQAPNTTQHPTLASYLWVVANWGTTPKAIFITLYHWNIQNSLPPANPAIFHFNWRLSQSALYPGADIVYIDAEDMSFYCGFSLPSLVARTDVDYRLDLTRLFSCVSDRGLFTEPMPATSNIPVTQVLWANETTGINGSLWVAVHGQKTVSASAAGQATDPVIDELAAISNDDASEPQTARIASEMRDQCRAVPGCEERAAISEAGEGSTLEEPVERQVSKPQLRRAAQNVIDASPLDRE
ncbi:MAG: hypothetical protein ABW186_09095 [Rhodanobacteraceae bacterium]